MEINLIYILLIILLGLSLLTFIFFECDYLEPVVVFNIMMALSLAFALPYVEVWGLHVGINTCIVVIVGMFAFTCGGIIAKRRKNYIDKNSFHDKFSLCGNISLEKVSLISAIMIFMLALSVQELLNIANGYGNHDGILGIVKTIRPYIEKNEFVFSRGFRIRFLFAQCVAYLSIYLFINNIIRTGQVSFCYLWIILCYFPFTILTTGRAELLKLVIFGTLVFSIIYLNHKHYSFSSKKRILCTIAVSGILFIIAFFFYGNFTGKVISSTRTPLVILSHYLGLSIPALDKVVEKTVIESGYVGTHTLGGAYGNLRSLGMNLPHVGGFLPFVVFNGVDTNVYTSFYMYIMDFGVSGMCIILAIFGLLFTFCYEELKYGNASDYMLIIYAMYSYSYIMAFHDEGFLDMISTKIIYNCLIMWVLIKFLKIKSAKV